MKIEIIEIKSKLKPYSYLLIDDYLNNEELDSVIDELNFLSYKRKFSDNSETAKNENNQLKAKKHQIWLNDIYKDWRYSNYLVLNKKYFSESLFNKLIEIDISWRSFYSSSDESTLLNYYENDDYYGEHFDISDYTQIFWINKEPKKFSGGDFILTDFDHAVEYKNNRLIVFPSYFSHKVLPIQLNENTNYYGEKVKGFGRYSFTTFFQKPN